MPSMPKHPFRGAILFIALLAAAPRAGEVAGIHPAFNLVEMRPADFTEAITGMDVLPDGRVALCTWGGTQAKKGKVFLFDGMEGSGPQGVSYRMIADGLAEPMGLKVIGNEVFVTSKEEISKFTPASGSRDAGYTRSTAFKGYSYLPSLYHSFASGLEYRDGWFYLNLHSPLNSPPWPSDRCAWIRADPKAGKVEVLATGLREPNTLAVGPDGEFFTTDNQGEWLPSSKLIHLKAGRYYGYVEPKSPQPAGKIVSPPAVWIPQGEVGNSPSQPVLVDKGTYQGQFLIGDVRYGGLKRYFLERVNGEYQGAVFRFCAPAAPMSCGWNRLRFAGDGSLYLGGVGGELHQTWSWNNKLYGLQKLVPTGKTAFEMKAVRSTPTGLQIEFTKPVGPDAGKVTAYACKQWWYAPTSGYGGLPVGTAALPILSASVSPDGMRVDLEMGPIATPKVIHVQVKGVGSQTGEAMWSDEAWYTMLSMGAAATPVARGDAAGVPGKPAITLARIGIGRYLLETKDSRPFSWRLIDPNGSVRASGGPARRAEIGLPRGGAGLFLIELKDADGRELRQPAALRITLVD